MDRRTALKYSAAVLAGAALTPVITKAPAIFNKTSYPQGSALPECFLGAELDFMNVTMDGFSLTNYTFVDTEAKMKNRCGMSLPHADIIQLLPISPNSVGIHAGNILRDITISGCKLRSDYGLQGLTMFDGLVKNIICSNNKVFTTSLHSMTLSGVLSGSFTNNDADVLILPLRLGGGNNVYVLGFSKDSSINYGKIVSSGNRSYIDARKTPVRGAVNLVNFDYTSFSKFIVPRFKKLGTYKTQAASKFIAEVAMNFGEIYE